MVEEGRRLNEADGITLLFDMLRTDPTEWRRELRAQPDPDLRARFSRALILTWVAELEGAAWLLRQGLRVLGERGVVPVDLARVEEVERIRGLTGQVKATLKLVAEYGLFAPGFSLTFGDSAWKDVVDTVDTRNQLSHPVMKKGREAPIESWVGDEEVRAVDSAEESLVQQMAAAITGFQKVE